MSQRNFRQRKIDVNKKLPIIIPTFTDKELATHSGLGLEIVRELNEMQLADQEQVMNGIMSEQDTFELEGDDTQQGTGINRGKSSSRAIIVPVTRETPLENIYIPTPVVKKHARRKSDKTFERKSSYIRYIPHNFDKEYQVVDYDLDEQDEEWYNSRLDKIDGKMSLDDLELFIDRFEKVTGFEKQSLPTLDDMLSNREEIRNKTSHTLLYDVYQYWKQKRLSRMYEYDEKKYSNVGKPLLFQYEVPPDIDNPNPYVAFRPREREKQHKSRKNDQASYDKLRLLRAELERLRTLCSLVRKREILKCNYYRIHGDMLRRFDEDDERAKKRARMEDAEPMQEMNLQECISRTPIFSFLVQIQKNKPVEQLDSLIQYKKNGHVVNPTYRLSRLGRIAIDFNDDDDEPMNGHHTFADESDFGPVNPFVS